MSKTIDYSTKFKFEWAEGYSDITDKYVGEELSLAEFIYIITRRHHEVALENIMRGAYGCYDKHKCFVKYKDSNEWELFGRLDLGNDTDWAHITKELEENFDAPMNFRTHVGKSWSDLVREGKEKWELRREEK